MNISKLFALTACALSFGAVACAAQAQYRPGTADPSDPRAAPASVDYHSAFTGYTPMRASAATPDQLWRRANDEVGASGEAMAGMAGHAGHMPSDEADPVAHGGQEPHHTSAHPAAPPAAHQHVPAAAGEKTPPVDHAAMGHGAHHEHQGH